MTTANIREAIYSYRQNNRRGYLPGRLDRIMLMIRSEIDGERIKAREEGHKEGYEEGRSEGYHEGYKVGHQDGLEEVD